MVVGYRGAVVVSEMLEKVLALMLVAMLVLDADAVQLCWGLN